MKSIGIVGGAGPEAGSLLFNNIINNYQALGRYHDDEFPSIILYNYPFSRMIETEDASHNRNTLVKQLQEAVEIVEQAGSELTVIACNTLHTLIPSIKFNSDFINVVDVTLKKLQKEKVKRALVLGTSTSIAGHLYDQPIIEIIYVDPESHSKVMDCIEQILKNQYSQKEKKVFENIIDQYVQTKAIDAVVLGCTELSVLHQKTPLQSSVPIFDPIAILANELVARSLTKTDNK